MRGDTAGDGTQADEELITAALNAGEGDLRAFEELVRQNQKRIVADCRFMTRDESCAEDLAQEIFVKAFFGLRNFERRSSFRHWLQRIKVHHCLNHLKRQEGQKRVTLDEEIAEQAEQLQVAPDAHTRYEAMDDGRKIEIVLDSLPSTLRIPLIMREMDELSYEEIAQALGLSLSAVKMRMKRARDEFRRRYEALSDARKAQTAHHE